MKLPVTLALILIITSMMVDAGKVYRWTDSQGNVHFSDIPVKSGATELKPPPTSSDTGSTDRLDSQQELLKSWEEEREAKRKAREEAETKQAKQAANCSRARKRLVRATTSKYLYELDEDGNRKVLSFEERAKAEKSAKADVERYCD